MAEREYSNRVRGEAEEEEEEEGKEEGGVEERSKFWSAFCFLRNFTRREREEEIQ